MGQVYKLSTLPSVSEYIAGLTTIQPRMSNLQLRLLQEQYRAPNHTVTATQLAELLGIEGGRGAVNLMYGRLGRLFCEAIDFEPNQRDVGTYKWWSVWSSGYEERKPYRFLWQMHPEVVQALEHLGWIDLDQTTLRYKQIFSELVYEQDDRSPPDNRRQAQFKIGWKNAALKQRLYTQETLDSRLTWNNLGYRFGLRLGNQSEAEMSTAYNFLAQEYLRRFLEPNLVDATNIYPDEVTSGEVFREGAVRQISVNAYERDSKARQRCIEHYGASCFFCHLNFGKVFGQLGEGFIHVHHIRPISEIAEEYNVDPVKDLLPVCPNCHAMIHRRSPPLSVKEFKKLLDASKSSGFTT